jgi:nucleoside 2-deoxyribosyltransferase
MINVEVQFIQKIKRVLIIGSLHYKEKMERHKKLLEEMNREVKLPVLDDYTDCRTALDVIRANIERIKWADIIHMFWDGRSIGTIADWQTAVALGKKVIPIHIEEDFTYKSAMVEYWQEGANEKWNLE